VAENASGPTLGADSTFTTATAPAVVNAPAATTAAASGVSTSAATINGTVNPSGQATSYHFQYGTSTAYGSLSASQSAGSGTTTEAVSAHLTGLKANTTYHYRIVAQSAGGTTVGADNTFTLPSPPPPKPVRARLHVSRINDRVSQSGCESELNRASTSAVRLPTCDRGRVTFTGSIDPRANGQIITILLTARITGRALTVHGHARIAHGHYQLTVNLPGRETDFLQTGHNTGGDRWRYTITYPGSSSLQPAHITGHLTLEIEHLKGDGRAGASPHRSSRHDVAQT
jgi:hypothetical protein